MKLKTVPLIAFAITVVMSLSALNCLAGSDVRTIDTGQLHAMVVDNAYKIEGGREKQFTVIDARTRQEYDEAHVFSAVSIPEREFERGADLLPKDRAALVVVYGNDAGSETGRKWTARAIAAGYTNLAIYSEGFLVWKEKKMPVAPLRTGVR